MDNDNDPREKSERDHDDRSGDNVVANLPTGSNEIEDEEHENGSSVDKVDGEIDDVVDKAPQGDKESDDVQNHTLESLSEEFDQFLSTLHVKDDDGDNEDDKAEDYPQIPHSVGIFLELFEEKLSSYDSGEAKIKWCQEPEEMHTLIIASVDRVSKLMSLLKKKSCLDRHELLFNHVGSVQQRAMAFLEDEFRVLLEDFVHKESLADDKSSQRKSIDQTSDAVSQDHDQIIQEGTDDSCTDYPGYPEEVVNVLKKIADEMTRGGYGRECREVYSIARRNMLLQRLRDDEFEKVSIDEVQKMSWETLEGEIPIWIKTFKNCSSLFFPGELKLTERIFPGDQGSLFCIITHCLAIHLLGFAEAVSMTIRSTEKLFKILDMYETLRDGFPEIVGLFPEEYRSELSNEMASARSGLGDFAILIFSDLENSIKSDSSKTPVPGGAVHPLTRYTMNYLKYSCEYKDTLEQVFKSHAKIDREEEKENGESPFSNQLMRIMDLLDTNLEMKSKLYKDIALSSIFMMNNGRYIVQKTKGSAEIHEVMGDTWCRRRSSDLRIYHKNYQRETWGKLLGFFGHEGLMHNGKIVKPNLKERFKSFNATFDEIHKTQSSWVVNDEQLQSELRVSITAVIIPAYRAFMARFGQYLDPGRQTEKYVKFQPEDVEDLIDELFAGHAASSILARKRT